jgi:TolB-like protein/Flp pilus assembly protein TadD
MERRLTAILAADVAGYSQLMGTDEARTVSDLKAHQAVLLPMISEFSGRIIDTAGDGILAEFASAVRAVECAVAIQKTMAERNAPIDQARRMQFRIGINIGDVIGDEARIYGDGVNVAARLEALADPGGIMVSRTVHDQVRDKLSFDFEDRGEQTVKNIARPIGVYRVSLAESPPPATFKPTGAKTEPSTTNRPSIAVLPFANMSGDPEQEYFADGISEDIITGLSKLRWFFVIARNSSFAYRGKAVDVKRAARELDVRYVLEGSVRKGGNRVRITALLVDATTGNHIWADRYDGDLTDIFALQDEITEKVVAAIEPRLLEAEGIRSQSRSTEDLGAWDVVMQANSLFWRLTKTEGEAAIAMLKQAVERYPDYAPAHSILAFAMLMSRWFGWTLVAPQIEDAATLAARATELDDSDPWAHLTLGIVAHTRRRTDAAVQEYQRAIDLNSNFAAAYGYLGWTLAMAGRTDEAIAHLEQAIRMSPHDPQNAIFNNALAVAYYLMARYSEAVSLAQKAVQQRDGLTAGHRIYIASLAQAGQVEEARSALRRLRELQPNISIAWCEEHVPYPSGPMAKFIEGIRKAGLE